MAQAPARTAHVVVVGAGFAGLNAARALARRARGSRRSPVTPLRVTLVDRHNYHTFQPLLYQVATSGLHPQDVGHSVRVIFGLRRRSPRRAAEVQRRADDSSHRTAGRAVDFRMGTVEGIDLTDHTVSFEDGGAVGYDYLVLAAGAVSNDFGIPGVDTHGFALKSLAHATTLRNHILGRFEAAAADPSLIRDGDLTFVVAGAGPTGVELAGALAELRQLLRRDHPAEAVDRARILLVEMKDQVLPSYTASSGAYTRAELERRGVEVRLATTIERVDADRVHLAGEGSLAARTLIWTAGVKANPLAGMLDVDRTGGGRVAVGADLRVAGHPSVFAIGDIAGATDRDGQLLPQLAPVAIQQGDHVADQIARRIDGRPGTAFTYRDKGVMATIGRNAAIAELPFGIRLRGFPAWISWLLLHLLYLVGFRNRIAVLLSWLYNYVSWGSTSRLIIDQTEHDVATELDSRPR